MRLARPDEWAREYLVGFDRYRKLDGVRTVHGTITGLSLDDREVVVRLPDGTTRAEPYDVLVISTGVTNGFWRRPDLQSDEEVAAALRAAHEQLAAAGVRQRHRWGRGCGQTPRRTSPSRGPTRGSRSTSRATGRSRSTTAGSGRRSAASSPSAGSSLHPGHRAVVPPGFDLDRITTDPVAFSTGQPDAPADATLWAIGRVRPNTASLPDSLLDEEGFVRVSPDLSVVGAPGVFAIGDVAATDPLRGSARNRADRLLAANIRRHLAGRPLRTLPRPPSALGLGPRIPARRAARVHAVGPVLPLPRLVDPDGPPAVDRAAGHLRRRPQEPCSVTVGRQSGCIGPGV